MIFFESYVCCYVPEALPAEVKPILFNKAARVAAAGALLDAFPELSVLWLVEFQVLLQDNRLRLQLGEHFLVAAYCHSETTAIPNFSFMKLIASCFVTLCFVGIFLFISFLRFILKPGRSSVTQTSSPIIPIAGS